MDIRQLELIEEYFRLQEQPCYLNTEDDPPSLRVQFKIGRGPVAFAFCTVNPDGTLTVQSTPLCAIDEEHLDAVRRACCRSNHQLRYAKFYLNGNNDLVVRYHLPPHTDEDVAEVAGEMLSRLAAITDEAFPHFARALYTA